MNRCYVPNSVSWTQTAKVVQSIWKVSPFFNTDPTKFLSYKMCQLLNQMDYWRSAKWIGLPVSCCDILVVLWYEPRPPCRLNVDALSYIAKKVTTMRWNCNNIPLVFGLPPPLASLLHPWVDVDQDLQESLRCKSTIL